MGYYKPFFIYLSLVAITFVILFLPFLLKEEKQLDQALNILVYSSFMKPWGAGPGIAKKFKEEYGIDIHWIDAGNAGLILERLKFKKKGDRIDVVLGIDQFSLEEARGIVTWRDIKSVYEGVSRKILPNGFIEKDFFAFDWGAMSFIYREGEVNPPQHMDDLLNSEFSKKLIIQDPRMSSPGLQFLFWVLSVKGVDEGFSYLEKLRDSIKILSPSWSSGYSLFQVEKDTIVFSYLTSPLYHKLEEKKHNYRSVTFSHPHPVQVEYAGIPETCKHCDEGFQFLKFIATKEIQSIIMKKNYMMPINGEALVESDFTLPAGLKYLNSDEGRTLMRDKKKLIERWKKVFY